MIDKKNIQKEDYFDDITRMLIKEGRTILKAPNDDAYCHVLDYIISIQKSGAISVFHEHYLDKEKTKIIGTEPIMREIILSPNVDENIKKTIEHILNTTQER